MHYFQLLLDHWRTIALSGGILIGAILCSLIVRWVLFFLLKRVGSHSVFFASLIRHSERVSRWILPLLALLIALPATALPERIMNPLQHGVGIGIIAAIAWLFILATDVLVDMITSRYRVDVADNLLARKVQTQLSVLHRVVAVAVVLIALGAILMTFPAIRSIGTSLLASAGLIGLVVGMAMRPTISSLVAGVQIALTQPIRLEDVVIVEGEWGWIEEISTTYVVVRIWDLRRLVLPLSYFIEHPFQNWTRSSSDLLGTVLLWVDYGVPVAEVRNELGNILKSTKLWKGQVCSLQVTDTSEHSVQLRALMDARDSGAQWDLRCYVREKLIAFLQQHYPESLPRYRAEFRAIPGDFKPPRRVPAERAAREQIKAEPSRQE
ncbi:MAG TPA: mechanosensitive ion channel domain-containing protein [Candidatus Limnocylindrales bacterium]|nr:mechanosensitive ion channel domain-containing protein [Candidatus Limnocylindrales bacterium]